MDKNHQYLQFLPPIWVNIFSHNLLTQSFLKGPLGSLKSTIALLP